MTRARLVIIESPYAGATEANVNYARRALADSLGRGEAPIASHLLYTQPGVLDDRNPAERAKGIAAGLEWGRVADAAVFYVDRGWSEGMIAARAAHRGNGLTIEIRDLDTPRAPPMERELVTDFLSLKQSEKGDLAIAIGVARAVPGISAAADIDREFLSLVRNTTGKTHELRLYVGAIMAERRAAEARK